MGSNLDNRMAVNKDLRIQNVTISKKSLAVFSSTVSGDDKIIDSRTILPVEMMVDGAPNEKVFPVVIAAKEPPQPMGIAHLSVVPAVPGGPGGCPRGPSGCSDRGLPVATSQAAWSRVHLLTKPIPCPLRFLFVRCR